ncbi:uncharacterized protein [Oscarella lobularis]|uniref:uncharacterized protein isoform X2 n=1 Tax=Oscarella lobularis TaxID=121494 RepID=UPI0033138C8B
MDDADLEKLSVSPGKLKPTFRKNTTEYEIVVGSDVKELKVNPLTSSDEASYDIKGGDGGKVIPIDEGATKVIVVEVSAEDGKTTKRYVIRAKRLSSTDASLSNLTSSSGNLNPDFSPSTYEYTVNVSAEIDAVKLITEVADAKARVSFDGSSADVGSEQDLNFGQTKLKILVTSPDGKNESRYAVTFIREHVGCSVETIDDAACRLRCSICLGILYQPVSIKGSKHGALFCEPCLSTVTRTSKVDPVDESPLEGDWVVERSDVEASVSDALVTSLSGEKVKLRNVARANKEWREKNSQPKIESAKADGCSSDGPDVTHSVAARPWETKLRQEGADFSPEKCAQWLTKYATSLSLFRTSSQSIKDGESPVDYLYAAAACQANAIKAKSKNAESHFKLAQILEEIYLVQDLYGIKKSERDESDDFGPSAVESSKDEEFAAICALRGVGSSAPLARQLKAVEEEYKHLKDQNQTAKAEHVQSLYQWKSKQAVRGSKFGMASSVDDENDLGKAFLKYMDALALDSASHRFNLHVGRLLVMQDKTKEALERLKIAMAIKPNTPETRLFYGLALCRLDSGSEEGARWLNDALQYVLHVQCELACSSSASRSTLLSVEDVLRVSDPLIVRAFIGLAETRKKVAGKMLTSAEACRNACLIAIRQMQKIVHRATIFRQFEWVLLDAHYLMLDYNEKNVSRSELASRCERLSVLSRCSTIPPEKELLAIQIQVCQKAVSTLPSSSLALCHLGAVQLSKFEQSEGGKDVQSLIQDAIHSFRASIAVEGKPKQSKDVLTHLAEQKWWKEKLQKEEEAKKQSAPKASAKTGQQQQQSKGAGVAPVVGGRGRAAAVKPGPVAGSTGRGRGTAGTARAGPTTKPSVAGAKSGPRPVGGRAAGPSTAGRGPASGKTAATKTAAPVGARKGSGSTAAKGPTTGSKGVATLGELKSGLKSSTSSTTTKPTSPEPTKEEAKKEDPTVKEVKEAEETKEEVETNAPLYQSRLGLARALSKQSSSSKECEDLYREVMKMSPGVHDAYIELADLLVKDDPLSAVAVYTQFPFSKETQPTFDDAYIHGEIVRLLMKVEQYDHPSLKSNLVAMGRVMGIASLEKYANVLDAKFKTNLLKRIYAGVHNKNVDDPDLQAFFKFKCWI